jgi:hypothetical protein
LNLTGIFQKVLENITIVNIDYLDRWFQTLIGHIIWLSFQKQSGQKPAGNIALERQKNTREILAGYRVYFYSDYIYANCLNRISALFISLCIEVKPALSTLFFYLGVIFYGNPW